IQVAITDPTMRKFGFQLSARLDSNPSTQPAGLLAPGSDGFTQVLCMDGGMSPAAGCPASRGATLQWIEHTITAFNSPANATPGFTYTFNWTPPAASAGPVTLYASGNAGNGSTSTPLGTNT